MVRPAMPSRDDWEPLLERALDEDVGSGDRTSELVVAAESRGRARIEARAPLVVCGLEIAEAAFRRVDGGLRIERVDAVADGARVAPGRPLLRIVGRYRSILTAERTALNFLGRLCGIATQTRSLVERVADLGADLVDTRKTTPGWRRLEKYAVAVGGGVNHRVGLFDGVLVKDNHIAAAGDLETAVGRALSGDAGDLPVQIEVESEEMAARAVAAGARFLLLDNLEPEAIRRIVDRFAPEVLLEASGGIGPDTLRAYAETGVARISMGALTHSVPSADVALEIDPIRGPAAAAER